VLAREFAAEAAFFSIGTNDLIQYSLAVDRTNQELAHLASPYHPAILRLIELVVEGWPRAGPAGVGVWRDGERSARRLPAAGFGIHELSMEGSSIPR
jgi:phosphotransferase system enzyme I (PtsI)